MIIKGIRELPKQLGNLNFYVVDLDKLKEFLGNYHGLEFIRGIDQVYIIFNKRSTQFLCLSGSKTEWDCLRTRTLHPFYRKEFISILTPVCIPSRINKIFGIIPGSRLWGSELNDKLEAIWTDCRLTPVQS